MQQRDPLDYDALVIGAGISGLYQLYRLRELGFCEDHQIKLLTSNSPYICQVCNARLGISQKLADSILVETVSVPQSA